MKIFLVTRIPGNKSISFFILGLPDSCKVNPSNLFSILHYIDKITKTSGFILSYGTAALKEIG